MKRVVKRVLGGCGAGVLVLALVAGGLAVRLAIAPVSLEFLAGNLTRQVNSLMPGLNFDFRDVTLVWRPETGRVDLMFSAVSMGDATAGTRVEIPALHARINTGALLAGRLEPTEIHVNRPQFSVVWSQDALTQMADESAGAAQIPVSDAIRLPPRLRRLIDELARPHSDTPLASLSRVHLENAGVTLTERSSGLTWRMPQATIDLRRRSRGVVLEVASRLLPPPGTPAGDARISVSGLLSTEGQPDSLSISLTAFRPDHFIGALPAIPEFGGIGLPLDILLAISLPGGAETPDIGLSLKSEGGTVELPAVYPDTRRLGAVDIQTRFDPRTRSLYVEQASIGLDAATLGWRGTLTLGETGGLGAIDASANIARIGLRELLRYWPDGLAPGAWRWMDENMPAGQLSALDARYTASGPALATDSFRLTFDLQETEADILPPAPRLLDARGHAALTASELAIDLEGGTIDGLSVAGSRVVLEQLDSPDVQYGDVTLHMSESLSDILRLIDHPPLGYASAFGIAPEDLQGAAQVMANLRFPLLADLPLSDIGIDIRADLAELSVPDLYDGAGLEQGSMILTVTGERLEGYGQGVFMDIPLDFRWDETFDPAADALPSRFEIRTRLEDADMARLGVETDRRMNGPVSLDIVAEGQGPDLRKLSVTGDLSQATLEVSELGWTKPADMSAGFSLKASPSETGWRLDDLSLTAADGAEISASAKFGPESGLDSLSIKRLEVGDTSLSGHVARTVADGLHVVLSGSSIDLRGLLGALQAKDGEDDDPLAELTRFALDLRAGQAVVQDGIMLEDLSVNLVRTPERWRRVQASAMQTGGGAAQLSLMPREDEASGPRSFSLTSDNAGELMRGLGVLRNIDGGALDLQAGLELDGPELKANGTLRLRDFTLVVPEDATDAEDGGDEESALAAYVDDDGIAFDLAELPFRLEGGIYDIENARVNGPEIGLTLEGQVDRNFRRLNVNGVIVPAYRFNSLLGKIPLIGGIFSGGEGGGLFAMSYRVEGRLPEPDVSVNPMTAIMPGILRWPFEGSKGRLDPEDEGAGESPPAPEREASKPDGG